MKDERILSQVLESQGISTYRDFLGNRREKWMVRNV